MAVTDVSNLKQQRKQKKIFRFLKKLMIFIIAAALVVAVILTKDIWYPRLNGILNKIPSNDNSSELAGGYFPLSIEGGASYQLEKSDNAFVLLDDAHFVTYNLDGKVLFTKQHTFAKPILTVSGQKSLIYDLGGTSFSLLGKYKEVYSKSTDYAILLARLSGSDYAAVVTKSDKFMSMLMIYDGNGQNIFNYGSVERIIDVTFNSDSTGCYITTIGSEDGVIVSKIMYYRFDGIDRDEAGNPVPVWQTNGLETLAISVRLFGSDKILVFGDNLCAYYDNAGNLLNTYNYENELCGYDSDENNAVLLFRNTELRTASFVSIDGLNGTVTETALDKSAENIQLSDGAVLIHGENSINEYTPLGEELTSVKLESDYDNFRKIGSYIFLMGYDKINRIDFNG